MPSVNDGPSELPDSGLAATSLSAGSPTSRITVRRPRVLLVQRFALGLRSFALCLLGRFALDLAGGFTLRLLRRLALRAFGSLDLRFLSGFALCLPRRL